MMSFHVLFGKLARFFYHHSMYLLCISSNGAYSLCHHFCERQLVGVMILSFTLLWKVCFFFSFSPFAFNRNIILRRSNVPYFNGITNSVTTFPQHKNRVLENKKNRSSENIEKWMENTRVLYKYDVDSGENISQPKAISFSKRK